MINNLDDFIPDDPSNPFNDPPLDAYKDFEGNLILPTEDEHPLVDLDEEYKDLLK